MSEATSSLPWLRIIVEGVVVVGSILLAFGIDASWDRQQGQGREAAYLNLLVSDLRATLASSDRFGPSADSLDEAAAQLVQAYYTPDLPPTDSLFAWFARAAQIQVVQPRLGTAESLEATGDLALIRDPALKVAIQEYLNEMTFFEAAQDQAASQLVNARVELSRHVNLSQVGLNTTTTESRDSLALVNRLSPYPSGTIRTLPRLNLEAAVRDREVHSILFRMLGRRTWLATLRRLMRDRAEELLRQVEASVT